MRGHVRWIPRRRPALAAFSGYMVVRCPCCSIVDRTSSHSRLSLSSQHSISPPFGVANPAREGIQVSGTSGNLRPRQPGYRGRDSVEFLCSMSLVLVRIIACDRDDFEGVRGAQGRGRWRLFLLLSSSYPDAGNTETSTTPYTLGTFTMRSSMRDRLDRPKIRIQ